MFDILVRPRVADVPEGVFLPALEKHQQRRVREHERAEDPAEVLRAVADDGCVVGLGLGIGRGEDTEGSVVRGTGDEVWAVRVLRVASGVGCILIVVRGDGDCAGGKSEEAISVDDAGRRVFQPPPPRRAGIPAQQPLHLDRLPPGANFHHRLPSLLASPR